MDALNRARTFVHQQAQTSETSADPVAGRVISNGEISEISEITRHGGAVATLRRWLDTGRLGTLPEQIPGFVDELADYSERARLIGMVRAILDAVPWSLTAEERAVQFVAVLTPLIERTEP
jgi:hypothetical protein